MGLKFLMNNIDLISQCFYYLNTFKRHRALANIKRSEGNISEAILNELKMYQFFDNLELGLRALQKSIYESKGGNDDVCTSDHRRETDSEGAGTCE